MIGETLGNFDIASPQDYGGTGAAGPVREVSPYRKSILKFLADLSLVYSGEGYGFGTMYVNDKDYANPD